jgi:hypothetical protein
LEGALEIERKSDLMGKKVPFWGASESGQRQ